mgnify:CR=1 FL=1
MRSGELLGYCVRVKAKVRKVAGGGFYGVNLPERLHIKLLTVPVVAVTPLGTFSFVRKITRRVRGRAITSIYFPKKYNDVWIKLYERGDRIDVYIPVEAVAIKFPYLNKF